MTGKERFLTALNRGEPDMVPIWDLAFNEPSIVNIAKHFTDNVPPLKLLHQMDANDLVAIMRALFLIAEELDLDGLTMPTLLGREHIEGDIIRDRLGVIQHVGWHGDPIPFDGPIKSPADLKTYKPPKVDDSWLMAAMFAKSHFKGRIANVLMMPDPFKISWALRGEMIHTLIAYIDNPAFAHDTVKLATEICLAVFERAVAAGVDAVVLPGDIAMNEATIMSPSHFREYLKPRYKEIVDVVHAAGLPAIKHSDGNLNSILDDLLEIGFDAVHPIQPQCMDIAETKKKCAGRACVIGNIDCVDLLTSGSVEEVERTVKETIEIAAPGGGYILSSSNTIHPDVKPENAIAMFRAARRHGAYPIGGADKK